MVVVNSKDISQPAYKNDFRLVYLDHPALNLPQVLDHTTVGKI